MTALYRFAVLLTITLGIAAGLLIRTLEWREGGEMDEEFESGGEAREMGYMREAIRWYNFQRAYPHESVPDGWRERAMAQIAGAKTTGLNTLSWSSIGPANVAGRSRAIAVDPTNSNIIYAGSVSGGVFKTTTGGSYWFPTTDNQPTMVISWIAIDPNNTNIVYAGTGEGYFNVDALRGAGILKSTNGGATWTQLRIASGVTAKYRDYFVFKVLVRPDNSQILYAALLGGVFKSTNAGTSWTRVHTTAKSPSFCTDLVMDPNSPATMYAAYGLFDGDGVYKTTDGGVNWVNVSTSFASGYSRISLGIGKSNSQVVYACLCDAATSATNAIMKTTDGGGTWSKAGTPFDSEPLVNNSHLGGQGWYNNVINVDPTDANVVYTGGINVFKSTNGGTSWNRISNGYGSPYMHVDQHAITFDPANHSRIWFGNDGGLFLSTDAGASFKMLDSGYVTTQFYSGATHPAINTRIGGTQDNGTLRTVNNATWNQIYSGDGGYTAIHQTTTSISFTEYVYMELIRITTSGGSSSSSRIMTGIPTVSGTTGTNDRCAFIAPVEMDPVNSDRLICGSYRVYLTTNRGSNWSAISPDVTGDPGGAGGVGSSGSVISALAFAPSAASTLYAATSGSTTARSQIAMTTNLTTWSILTPPPPNRYFSSIAVDPANASHVYVGVSGYNDANPGHIFVTTNPSGGSWTNISGNLPDIPVNKVLLDPANLAHILAGTDLGVFETLNSGTTWTQTTGIPNVAVMDLDIRTQDGRVLAATHGRGMYFSDGALDVDPGQPSRAPAEFRLDQNFPNPFNPATTINFSLAQQAKIRLTVYDAAGREVGVLDEGMRSAGNYTRTFGGSSLASGVYFCNLTVEPSGEPAVAPIRLVRKMLLVK